METKYVFHIKIIVSLWLAQGESGEDSWVIDIWADQILSTASALWADYYRMMNKKQGVHAEKILMTAKNTCFVPDRL